MESNVEEHIPGRTVLVSHETEGGFLALESHETLEQVGVPVDHDCLVDLQGVLDGLVAVLFCQQVFHSDCPDQVMLVVPPVDHYPRIPLLHDLFQQSRGETVRGGKSEHLLDRLDDTRYCGFSEVYDGVDQRHF